ncbi:hypothetical protein [Actinoplanes sp. NPDC049265]|uniref:hypothetical protein n=1 Tax=Actinoplanes sp. NPDC049265 TaxID=3363902 RepID=UPI00371A837C
MGRVVTSVETQYRDRGIGAPPEQRKEFRRAFSLYGWARPGIERPVARPHVTLIIATVSTVAALLTGVIMQLIKPVKIPKPAAPPPVKAAAPTWAAITGWDCAAAGDRGFEADNRQASWITVARGGWSGDGCHGDYEAIPFTTDKHTRGPVVEWWFTPAGAMKKCLLSVYVPAPDDEFKPVPAAHYSVLGARGGTEFARFTVDQTKNAGSWVAAGSFPVNRSGIAVRLNTGGKPPTTKSMLAVTQVKAACTG